MKKLFFAAVALLVLSGTANFIILKVEEGRIREKDNVIAGKDLELVEKEAELETADASVAKLEGEKSDYQKAMIDIVMWAKELFPWGAGGAIENLTNMQSINELNLEEELRKLPLSIPEAEQRARFLEKAREYYPLSQYNWAFAKFGWGYPILLPEKSYISEEFVKYYRVRTNGRYVSGPHPGIDIVSPWESSIIAVADGRVTVVHVEPLFVDMIDVHPLELYEKGMGTYVVIEHQLPTGEMAYSVYGHLIQAMVGVGETVKKGETIGIAGSTGLSSARHLHFEIRKYYTQDQYVRLNPFTNSLQGNVVYTTFYRDGKFE